MNTNQVISLDEISRLIKHVLHVLCLADILHLENDRDVIIKILRKLYITSLLGEKKVICITGLQGAGKTTMIKKFYGIEDKYMPGTLGVGERIPVFISEKGGINTPVMYAVKVSKNEKDEYSRVDIKVNPGDYEKLTSGEDSSIMYLELLVPYKYTNNENTSLMLLPGYEMNNSDWDDLIDFSVSSSDAAVCVFEKVRYATAENEIIIKKIQSTFGKNLVYALNHSDEGDGNKALKNTVLTDFGIPESEEDRVVCTGCYGTPKENEEWIKALKNAIQKYAAASAGVNSAHKNRRFLYNSVMALRNKLIDIQSNLSKEQTIEKIQTAVLGNQLLNAFDSELKRKRSDLEKHLDNQYESAKKESGEKLEKYFTENNLMMLGKGIRRVFFGEDVKSQFVETRKRIELALGMDSKKRTAALPDVYLRKALEDTLRGWQLPDTKTNTARLLETKKNDDPGKPPILLESGKTEILVNDVSNILTVYDEATTIKPIQCKNDKMLMRAVVEMGTYYMTLAFYDELSERIGLNYYSPVESELSVEKVVKGAEECKKLVVGLAGVAGIDILEGGGIDFAAKIAGAFGIAAPAAAAIVAGVIVVGAGCAVIKDINKMNCADFLSAKKSINNIYDSLKGNALEIFDDSMARIRQRIADNI